MEFELTISLISLTLAIMLAIYTYRMGRKLELLLNAVNSKAVVKALTALRARRKPRRRYMVFELISDREVSAGLLEYEVRNTFKKLFGEVHLARAALTIQYFNNQLNIGIIKYSHMYRYKVLAVLGVMRKVGDVRVVTIPLRTTSSLKKALKYVRSMEASMRR